MSLVNKVFFLLLGVRDYIHVVDLAKGHIAALKKLKDDCGCKVHVRKEYKPKRILKHIFWFVACSRRIAVSVGLQPGNRNRLLCVPDGESHGEGIRERGE